MAITKEDILEAVGQMSVMDLNDLVKAFEEKFGVSAAAMAVAGPAAGAGGGAAAVECMDSLCRRAQTPDARDALRSSGANSTCTVAGDDHPDRRSGPVPRAISTGNVTAQR